MKIRNCSKCGSEARATYSSLKGKGTQYGVMCREGHFIPDEYGTKNRAIQAWNECQSFFERYSPLSDDLK